MEQITFKIYGHENTLSLHRNSIEFTKEDYLTKKGDCILGINADFDIARVKEFVKEFHLHKVNVTISVPGVSDSFETVINSDFDSEEMVIRKTDFLCGRTFGIKSTKASIDIDRKIVEYLTDANNSASVVIEKL